jgi:hypothetical protein
MNKTLEDNLKALNDAKKLVKYIDETRWDHDDIHHEIDQHIIWIQDVIAGERELEGMDAPQWKRTDSEWLIYIIENLDYCI